MGACLILVLSSTNSNTSSNLTENKKTETTMKVYDLDLNFLSGDKLNWDDFKGKRIIFVNVASKCGLTPQYETLESIYKELDKEKYAIIGVPANNFLKQEPGNADKIESFCQMNYGVTFPILEKVYVSDYVYLSYPPKKDNSEKVETSPLYEYLTKKEKNGVMDIEMTWNFQKIFVNESGEVYAYLEPKEIDASTILETFLQQ